MALQMAHHARSPATNGQQLLERHVRSIARRRRYQLYVQPFKPWKAQRAGLMTNTPYVQGHVVYARKGIGIYDSNARPCGEAARVAHRAHAR